MNSLDIVIVNWNAGEQLADCLDSIRKATVQVDLRRIIVVDNGSIDGSENAAEGLENLTLIRAGTNLGFAKACNLGATQSTSEFLLFLNPDSRLFPDSLSAAVKFMTRPENAEVGICCVQLIDENGTISRSCSRFPSTIGFVAHAMGLDRLIPKLGHFMREWDHSTTRKVDQVMGAFFLVRRCLYRALNGFDEQFFVYFEEVDFSYRAKRLGWYSIFLADTRAFHAGGGISRQVKAKRLFYSLRSRILYAFKHFNPFGATVVVLVTIFLEPFCRSTLAIARGSWPSLRETWAGYSLLSRWLPAWLLEGMTR